MAVDTPVRIPVTSPPEDLLTAAKVASAYIRTRCRGPEASVVLRLLDDAIQGQVGEVLRRYAQELLELTEGRTQA